MRSGILPGHRDDAVRPQDDLFGHANGTWVRETEIPADRGRYGTFDMLREQSDERVRTIIERAAADTDAPAGSPTRKVGDLYRSFMDEARVEELGLAPIADDLAAIELVGDRFELFQTRGRLQREGGPGLFDLGVAPDAKNPEEYVLYPGQGGLGLPDESYYREDSFAPVREAYLAHVTAMLELGGFSDAGSRAARVLDLESRIASHHWDRVACRDTQKTYNLLDGSAVQALVPTEYSGAPPPPVTT